MKRLALLLAALVACGPKGKSTETMPTLPGDDQVAAAGTPDAGAPPPRRDPDPDDGKEDPDPWAGRTDLIPPPAPSKPTAVALPKIERFTLPNGLKVLVVENHNLPVVSLHLAVNVGTADETRDKRALADFAAAMLTRGTKHNTADQLAESIDYVGGSLGAAADFESTHVTCEVLAKDVGTCLELLPEIVIEPTFPKDAMKEIADQLVTAVRQTRDSAQALAGEHLENALWGDDHVRGWPVTEGTIGAISAPDLVKWHGTYFKPDNAVLAIAGDVDVKELRGRLAKSFAPWKKGAKAPGRKKFADPKLSGRKIVLVDKPDQTQSQIVVGNLGIAHTDKDYFATILMNYTLGGGAFSSRLMKVVRSEGGKTYGASSQFERWKTRGTFEAATFTRNKETLSTLGLVIGEILKMKESGPTEAELADAQSNIAGNYPLNFESASRIATAVLSAELHNLGEAYVRDFPLKIAAVKLAEAKAAAAKRLDGDNLVIVIVGRAADVAPQLDGAGVKYDKVDYLAPISKKERLAREAAKNAPPDPKLAKEGKRLMDEALKAKGGADKLKAIKDVVTKGEAKITANGRTITGKYGRWFVAPSQLRIDLAVEGVGAVATVITEKSGWIGAPQGIQILPPDVVAMLQIGTWLQPEMLYLHHLDKNTTVQSQPREKVGAVEYDVVLLKGPFAAKVLLDTKSHLVYRVYYDFDGRQIYDEYGAYQDVDGVQIAHVQRNEDPVLGVPVEITYTEVKVNGGVIPETFAQPAKAK